MRSKPSISTQLPLQVLEVLEMELWKFKKWDTQKQSTLSKSNFIWTVYLNYIKVHTKNDDIDQSGRRPSIDAD